MTHKHTAETTRRLPGNVTLDVCSCGARKLSNDTAICGGVLDTDGWYVQKKEDENRRAYDLLQNEGYEPETRDHDDIADGVNSNIPNID
jgi:hypothetical protein